MPELLNGAGMILRAAAISHAKKNGAGNEEISILEGLEPDIAWLTATIVYGEPNSAKDDDPS